MMLKPCRLCVLPNGVVRVRGECRGDRPAFRSFSTHVGPLGTNLWGWVGGSAAGGRLRVGGWVGGWVLGGCRVHVPRPGPRAPQDIFTVCAAGEEIFWVVKPPFYWI